MARGKSNNSIEKLDKNFRRPEPTSAEPLRWIRVGKRKNPQVHGLAWFDENGGRFSRLPLRAEEKVREPVWNLAQRPSGARVAFRSNTTSLAARVKLSAVGSMQHMAPTGSGGLSLYAGEPNDRLRQWKSAIPNLPEMQYQANLFEGIPERMREFRLYLPLYLPLERLELGLSEGARLLSPSPYRLERPVVFYGSSITQGGCASTAGGDFVSRIGRMLNIDVVNLGFSGNGKGEPEVVDLINEIDASCFVLDYAGNSDAKRLRKTLPYFHRTLRRDHPRVPIALVSNLTYFWDNYDTGTRELIESRRDALIDFYIRTRKRGDENLHFIDGMSLIPFNQDGAFVDGVHPTELGFQLIADRLAPFLERILFSDLAHS